MLILRVLSKKAAAVLLSVIFFVIGLLTLSGYGINWDTINHLPRGQAFLHYFLTGTKDYTNLDKWNLFREKEELLREKTSQEGLPRNRLYFQDVSTIVYKPDLPRSEIPRISMYQNVDNDFGYFMKHDGGGHPPLSDILSSAFNYVLFQKLGLLNDIDAYRVYSIFLSSILIGLVFWWTGNYSGRFAGVVAALSLALYPLFWSESHFNNEKDIPETVFWSLLLFSFWKGVTNRSWKWMLSSGIFFGLALGTKFNALFSIFVILPWFAAYAFPQRRGEFSIGKFVKKHRKVLLAGVAAPFLGFTIFFVSWPYLWSDPIGGIKRVVGFYTEIGTASSMDPKFLGLWGINTFAIQWIFYTTPLVILFLASIGIAVIGLKLIRGDKNKLGLLFILWFIVPIIRVTYPGSNIYGGVRHIMEFIPALAIIAGVGAGFLRGSIGKRVKSAGFTSLLILILFIPITLKLIEIHPNENVYFNSLIGGFKGASERNFPGWGVSFGAPYREGIDWINKNAEPGAKLTLAHELLINIPTIFIRPDIDYKDHRSGYLQQGEYVMSLVFHGTDRRSYSDMYLNNMVEPIYQVLVDDVPILKIWKNDKEFLKPEWRDGEVLDNVKTIKEGNILSFDIGSVVKLSRLEATYDENDCSELSWGYLMISKDGKEWERVPGVLPEEFRFRLLGKQPRDGKFIEPFAGQEAKYINFFVFPEDTCVTQIEGVQLYYFR